jgi:serine protease Do
MTPDPIRSPVAKPPRRRLMAFAFAAMLVAAMPALADGPNSFAPLVKRVQPAVVSIRTTETVQGEDPLAGLPPEFQQLFRQRLKSRKQQMQGAGSGFVIDPSGYIVTNNHVVGSADEITVVLSDGTELPAKVVGTDDLTDVALIKVTAATSLPAVTWGDSRSVEVGDWVVCAGNPFQLGGTITAGIVSARGRDIGSGPFDDFLQIDAPINPGNSGGPVFNMQGQVVGVDTAIASPTGASVGIGFAIPSEIASKIVAELREHGRIERGWLGATLQDVPDNEGKGTIGVGITAVERGGPGQKSGLRPGDIVTSVNGQSADSSRTLIRAVAATPPGGTVRVAVRRQGRDLELNIVVGRRPSGQG